MTYKVSSETVGLYTFNPVGTVHCFRRCCGLVEKENADLCSRLFSSVCVRLSLWAQWDRCRPDPGELMRNVAVFVE